MTDPKTRTVDVKGRSVSIKALTDAQLLLMSRDAALMQNPNIPNEVKVQAGGWILDAFESVIVSDEDKAYVLLLMRMGELELSDFIEFLHAKTEEPQKPVVRRGRPPRKSTV